MPFTSDDCPVSAVFPPFDHHEGNTLFSAACHGGNLVRIGIVAQFMLLARDVGQGRGAGGWCHHPHDWNCGEDRGQCGRECGRECTVILISGSLQSEQSALMCDGHCLGPVMDFKFLEQCLHVGFDRFFGNEHGRSNFLV